MRQMRSKFDLRRMHGLSLAVCLIGACCARVPGARAQTATPPLEPEANFRLLNATEGRSIVNAALEQDQPMRGTHDCSHMVHQIYLVAGFEYPYVSSFDIYAGDENFERVKIAQPGDLIVWPGHVGIVLDPVQRSFYSLVRTGLETQYYDGTYWKARGRPRFYRYKIQGQEILTAAKTPSPPRASKGTSQRVEPSVSEEQPAAGISDPNRPPRAVSERTPVNYGPKAPEEAEAPVTGVEVPQSIIIAAGNKQPTRDEVAEGISELSNAAGNVLRANDPSKLQMPVVIFERLSVERLEIKRNHGWARLQLETRVSLAGGGTDTRRRHEKVRWELRRTESGWEAVRPSNRTYVPRDVAVKNLAGQLARLTASEGAAAHQEIVLRQESQLANLLSILLGNQ
ncbi:MAG: hypothetical protein DMG43_07430 [Acidobacteria bacterium]|nr:MAG: hypothetical protein DMG43_07430 [Acidobacteriota bacterium]